MILIFGGAYQGKLEYAKENFTEKNTVFICSEDHFEIDFSKDIIHSFHLFILAGIRNGCDTTSFIESNLDKLKSKIIICDDISSGVVPIDKEMRLWRETVGRSMGLISKHSDEVIRVFCGIGTKIK